VPFPTLLVFNMGTSGETGLPGTGRLLVDDLRPLVPKLQDRRLSLSRLHERVRGMFEGPASALSVELRVPSSIEWRRPARQLNPAKSDSRLAVPAPTDPADVVLVKGAYGWGGVSVLGAGTAATGTANEIELARGGGAGMPLGPVPCRGALLRCGTLRVGLVFSLTGRRRGGCTTKCALGLT
jgi:hypothetical protein